MSFSNPSTPIPFFSSSSLDDTLLSMSPEDHSFMMDGYLSSSAHPFKAPPTLGHNRARWTNLVDDDDDDDEDDEPPTRRYYTLGVVDGVKFNCGVDETFSRCVSTHLESVQFSDLKEDHVLFLVYVLRKWCSVAQQQQSYTTEISIYIEDGRLVHAITHHQAETMVVRWMDPAPFNSHEHLPMLVKHPLYQAVGSIMLCEALRCRSSVTLKAIVEAVHLEIMEEKECGERFIAELGVECLAS